MKWLSFGKKVNPTVLLEMNEQGMIRVVCDWNKPNNDEEAVATAKAIASLCYLASVGKLVSTFQTSIVNRSMRDNDPTMSNTILNMFNNAMGQQTSSVDENEPIVSPDKAFNVRGNTT